MCGGVSQSDFQELVEMGIPNMHMVFGSIYLAWSGFIIDLSYVVAQAKLSFDFILEK